MTQRLKVIREFPKQDSLDLRAAELKSLYKQRDELLLTIREKRKEFAMLTMQQMGVDAQLSLRERQVAPVGVAVARELDLLTCPYVFTPEEAEQMATAGADILIPHMGLTTKGSIGAKSAMTLSEATKQVQVLADAALPAQMLPPFDPILISRLRAVLDARTVAGDHEDTPIKADQELQRRWQTLSTNERNTLISFLGLAHTAVAYSVEEIAQRERKKPQTIRNRLLLARYKLTDADGR